MKEEMKQISNGFLFGLGLLPILLIYNWLTFSYIGDVDLDAMEYVDEVNFDRSKLEIKNVKFIKHDESIELMGEIENLSESTCEFIAIIIDILNSENEMISTETSIISNLEGKTKRGFSTFNDKTKLDIKNLKHRISISQAYLENEL